jgi:hypothetical protein
VPFTISHAAAAVPLRRFGKLRLPLAAVMIGSMSPDYAYFMAGGFERVDTHSVPGVFGFCWPLSVVLWLAFVHLLEGPTTALLPEAWRSRFPPSTREISVRTLALASVAVLLGAFTHIIWDSFTHPGTAMTNAIPVLREVAVRFDGWHLRWFAVLQLLSSVLGLAVLGIWAWKQPPGRFPRPAPHAPVSNQLRLRAILAIVAISSALAVAGYLAHADAHPKVRVFYFLIGGMTGLMLAWCIVAVLVGRRSSAG